MVQFEGSMLEDYVLSFSYISSLYVQMLILMDYTFIKSTYQVYMIRGEGDILYLIVWVIDHPPATANI